MIRLTNTFPFVRAQTVDDMKAPLAKLATKLNTHAASHTSTADKRALKISKMQSLRSNNLTEANKAKNLVSALAELAK